MKQVMEHLLALQKLQLPNALLSPRDKSELLKLREQVPASLLIRFDRFIVRGKKAVAVVRNGVCSECHLRISSGTLASLAYTAEVHTCDNCGRYLHLPENEPLGFVGSLSPPRRAGTRAGRKVSDPAR